ncbi:MAG: Ada metal-binding domain-containing protein [Marmoricola sp.]
MTHTLTAADGSTYQSRTPGEFGGNRKQKVYGTMDCGAARSAQQRFPETFLQHRVFFADEAAAIAAGYRPCGSCLREKYRRWKFEFPGSVPAESVSDRD